MKQNKFLYGALGLFALGMTACSSDMQMPDEPQVADRDQTRYLNVSLMNPSAATRATVNDNFLNGTATENFVKDMTFVFYDKAGKPTGNAEPFTFTTNTADDGFTTNTDNQNVEKIWQNTVAVNLSQGENLPAYVVAFINPLTNVDLKKTSLADLDKVLRQQVKNGDNFMMSNSVYYGNNPVTGETNVCVFATPIATDQLYTEVKDAEKADAKAVDIYVERYAARVTLNLAPNTISDNEGVNGYKLTFVPEAWRVNATDKDAYVIKHFGLIDEDGVLDLDPTYTDLMTNFGGKDWWNEPSKFRSYWACSPSYYENSYPQVSDNITDVISTNDYTGTGTTAYPYAQHYFNYNQFISGTVGGNGVKFERAIPWDATNGFNQTFYARETTTASRAWKNATNTNYNPFATMASAVILGHYILTPTTQGATALGQQTFYLFGKTNDKYNLYLENGILEAMVEQQSVVLVREGSEGNYVYKPYRKPENGNIIGFTVQHPTKAVRDVNNSTVAGRLVALQLDGTNLTNLYYYDIATSSYQAITTDNLNKVNSDLLTTGYATRYGNGLAYFNIPIEHLGIYTSVNGTNVGTYVEGAKNTTTGVYDFTKCPAGSFGVVRNHAYTINVNSIKGLGTALRDETQPIVPPVNVQSYYISATLNVLSWRIVPAQSVNL